MALRRWWSYLLCCPLAIDGGLLCLFGHPDIVFASCTIEAHALTRKPACATSIQERLIGGLRVPGSRRHIRFWRFRETHAGGKIRSGQFTAAQGCNRLQVGVAQARNIARHSAKQSLA